MVYDGKEANGVRWAAFVCSACAGVTVVKAIANIYGQEPQFVEEVWPKAPTVSEQLPERARDYLQQALESKQAPAGAIILASSAIDSMLKGKGLKDGTLNARIDQAKDLQILTTDMAAWAHEIRLDANNQRHADESQPLPTAEDADRVILFAQALGQILYVLPALVRRNKQSSPASAQE